MLCGWGVKAGMVKLCVVISERFRKYIWYLKVLYKMSRFALLATSVVHAMARCLSICHKPVLSQNG